MQTYSPIWGDLPRAWSFPPHQRAFMILVRFYQGHLCVLGDAVWTKHRTPRPKWARASAPWASDHRVVSFPCLQSSLSLGLLTCYAREQFQPKQQRFFIPGFSYVLLIIPLFAPSPRVNNYTNPIRNAGRSSSRVCPFQFPPPIPPLLCPHWTDSGKKRPGRIGSLEEKGWAFCLYFKVNNGAVESGDLGTGRIVEDKSIPNPKGTSFLFVSFWGCGVWGCLVVWFCCCLYIIKIIKSGLGI